MLSPRKMPDPQVNDQECLQTSETLPPFESSEWVTQHHRTSRLRKFKLASSIDLALWILTACCEVLWPSPDSPVRTSTGLLRAGDAARRKCPTCACARVRVCQPWGAKSNSSFWWFPVGHVHMIVDGWKQGARRARTN